MSASGDGLLAGLFARGAAARATEDRALLQALLDVELALMRALVTTGLAPAQAAQELDAVADAKTFDVAELGHQTGEQGTPVPGLLAALRARLPETARAHLHTGATSQDILDTALMLVSRWALAAVLDDLGRAAAACATLAGTHRATVLPGRTLLQHALPVTFGLKAAQWLTGIEDARRDLEHVRDDVLALQFGGAVGTLAALGDRGPDVVHALARELDLPATPLPWHTNRFRPARLACALGTALGVMGKIARDLVLLSQTEVAEVAEGGPLGRGGSSAMPHKHNPVGAIAILACAGQGPGLVATVLAAMPQEHERGAGGWQAEWEPLRTLLRLTGSAASALAEMLAHLRIDPEQMRFDLSLSEGAIMSESVVTALSPALGRSQAQTLVRRAADRAASTGRDLGEVLAEDPEVATAIGADGLRRALDPENYLGATDELIERALAAHANR